MIATIGQSYPNAVSIKTQVERYRTTDNRCAAHRDKPPAKKCRDCRIEALEKALRDTLFSARVIPMPSWYNAALRVLEDRQ